VSMTSLRQLNLDKLGVCASAVCAVHCALTGLAFGLLSVSGLAFLDNERFDATFILIAASLGAFAVRHGIRQHHSYWPAAVFSFGIACVTLGHFFLRHVHRDGVYESFWTHNGHTVFMIMGGLSLVCFHILNIRLQRTGGCGCGSCQAAVPESS
jgi:MerC mercury resistance protein